MFATQSHSVFMKSLLVLPLLFLCNHLAFGQTAPLNIVYIGDSITAGATLPNHGSESPGVICTQVLQAKLAPRVVNNFIYGRSGHTTVDFLPATAKDFLEAETGARKQQTDHPIRTTHLFTVKWASHAWVTISP